MIGYMNKLEGGRNNLAGPSKGMARHATTRRYFTSDYCLANTEVICVHPYKVLYPLIPAKSLTIFHRLSQEEFFVCIGTIPVHVNLDIARVCSCWGDGCSWYCNFKGWGCRQQKPITELTVIWDVAVVLAEGIGVPSLTDLKHNSIHFKMSWKLP